MLYVLAAGALMLSCGEDGGVELTGLSVSNSNISLPIGESVKVNVTLTPSDAGGVQLAWSSSNENVATVSSDGVLTITGIGTAVITVSSGSVSTTFNVEGTIRGLTINAPADAEFRLGAEFQLTVTPDPAGAEVTPVWTSDNESVATVSATGEVVIKGEGTANIKATVGALSATYTVVCEDMLASAIGYWEFDDPSDICKALMGNPLVQQGADIKWVEGPSAENLAIEVPMHQYFIADLSNGTPNGGLPGDDGEIPAPTRMNQWTIMLDCRMPNERGYYYTQHNGAQFGDGDFFVRTRDGQIQAGKGSYFPLWMGDPNLTYTSWVRIILTFDIYQFRVYCDGVEPIEESGDYPYMFDVEDRFTLPVGPLYIFSEPNGTTPDGLPNFEASDDDNPFPCAAIAFWDQALNAGQVQSLGGIAH
jgi:hypothetical protein